MECGYCGTSICQLTDIMTYYKNDIHFHLVLKPEKKHIILDSTLKISLDKKKYSLVQCSQCSSSLGKELNIAPNGMTLVAFGLPHICLAHHKFAPKDKWSQFPKLHNLLDKRQNADFYESKYSSPVPQKIVKKTNLSSSLCFDVSETSLLLPSSFQDFDWSSFLSLKVPHLYQIEAFVTCCLRDTIVVLPTGTGKTLVASMVLSALANCNKEKMGLFLVDRIPLVFQQKTALESDTHLRVIGVYQDNITVKKMELILKGAFDVIVMTCGFFACRQNLLPWHIFHTVVFDECHHAIGNHIYVKTLKSIPSSSSSKPRILGLSASPFSVTSNELALKSYHKFMAVFPPLTTIIMPAVGEAQLINEKWIFVSLSSQQLAFFSLAHKYLRQIVTEVNLDICSEKFETLEIFMQFNYQIIGDLRILLANESFRSEKITTLLQVVESCSLVSLFGLQIMKEDLSNIPEFSSFLNQIIPEMSPRLSKLEEILRNSRERILIFTSTQESARLLHLHLKDKFPELRSSKIVGHGGRDGMNWHDDQRIIIEHFNSGKSKCLISTSILEEGLNVSSCDVVIRFSGTHNLLCHIQTRGRSRTKNGRYIVITDVNDKKNLYELKKLEKNLQSIISNVGHKASSREREIVTFLESNDTLLNLSETRRSFENSESHVSESCLIELYVEGLHKCETSEFSTELRNVFLIEDFEIVRFWSHDFTSASVSSHQPKLFSSASKCFMIEVQNYTGSYSVSPLKIYQNVIQYWDYKIDKYPSINIFTSNKNSLDLYSSTSEEDLILSQLSVGYYDGNSLRIHSKVPNVNMKMELQCEKEKEQILVKMSSKLTLHYSCKNSHGFAFMSVKDSGVIHLVIPLLHSPIFTTNEGLRFSGPWSLYSLEDFIRQIDKSNVIVLTFDYSNSSNWFFYYKQIHSQLFSFLQIFDTRIPEYNYSESTPILALDDEYFWSFNILRSSNRILISRDFERLLASSCKEYGSSIVASILKWLVVNDNDGYFTNIESRFLDLLKLSNTDFFLAAPSHSTNVYMRYIVITPSRRIFLPDVIVRSSRLIRKYKDQLIIVCFRDEDFGSIIGLPNLDFVRNVLIHGLLINSTTYYFFSSSPSQMRNQNSVFIKASSQSQVANFRKAFISFPEEFTSISKYISRLGLFGSSDIVLTENCEGSHNSDFPNYHGHPIIPDIQASNGVLLTDGAGIIRQSFADSFSLLDSESSVIQFRFSGAKGILVKVPDSYLSSYPPSVNLLFRPSQIKISSSSSAMSKSLTVITESKYNPLYLNQELINLLSSLSSTSKIIWNVDAQIYNLQTLALQKANKSLFESQAAITSLSSYMDFKVIKCVSKSFPLHYDQFWYELIKYAYFIDVKLLKEKSRIFVENGCRLLGMPDPYGLLSQNEVFIQIANESNSFPITLLGNILIFRNPCLHPGDLRVVKAVSFQEYKDFRNVIIFPAQKSHSSSLPDECSGGDLDGDIFGIIWDDKLIPPLASCYSPCNYQALAEKELKYSQESLTNPTCIADFIVKNMQNNLLGQIATKHLALCDILPHGACDSRAISLAMAQSHAVDFPKTGILPKVSSEILDLVKSYPDFMTKSDSIVNYYESKKILGKLYRNIPNENTLKQYEDLYFRSHPENKLFIVKNYENYMNNAHHIYELYSLDLKRLMSNFCLKSEMEAVLGCAYHWSSFFLSNIGKASQDLKTAYSLLCTKYRSYFFNTSSDDFEAKASGWLIYTYRLQFRTGKAFLSFPWIMYDVLCLIKNKKDTTDLPLIEDILTPLIGSIAVNLFKKTAVPIIEDKLNQAEMCLNKFNQSLESNGYFAHIYGSISMYLCSDHSDVDIFVRGSTSSLDIRYQLENSITRCLSGFCFKIDAFLKRKIPFLKAQFNYEQTLTCDVSMNKHGFYKTLYILDLYKENLSLLPTLWILIHWAQNRGFLKVTQNDNSALLPTAEFYAFILYLLVSDSKSKIYYPENSQIDIFTLWPTFLDSLRATESDKLYRTIGNNLLTFFQKASLLNNEITYEWPISEVPNVIISDSTVKYIGEECKRVLKIILITRNFHSIFDNCFASHERITLDITLNLSISNILAPSLSFHKERLLTLSKVDSLTFLEKKDSTNIVCKAIGIRRSIIRLRRELRTLGDHKELYWKCNNKSSLYFVQGSTKLFLINTPDYKSELMKAQHMLGHCNMLHTSRSRSVFVKKSHLSKYSSSSSLSCTWKKELISELGHHLKKQLGQVPINDVHLLILRIHFGLFYVLNNESAFHSSRSSVMLSEIEDSIIRYKNDNRKTIERPDFVVSKLIPDARVNERSLGNAPIKNVCKYLRPSFRTMLNGSNEDISIWKQVFIDTMTSLDFYEDKDIGFPKWKITITPTNRYTVCLEFDEANKCTSFTERKLSYVHVTILHGEEPPDKDDNLYKNLDIRLLVQTAKPVVSNTDLYQFVFPQNKSVPLIVTNPQNQIPSFSPDCSSTLLSKIQNIRQINEVLYYRQEKDIVCLTIGTQYTNDTCMKLFDFCEISYKLDPQVLKTKVRNQEFFYPCNSFSETLLNNSILIVDTLKEKISKRLHK